MHPIDHIKQFANITPELEINLHNVMREMNCNKGDLIQGVKNLNVYSSYIVKGSARVFYTEKGREHTVSFSFDNEFVVISPNMMAKYPETVAVQFLEPTEVIGVPHLKVKNLLEESRSVPDTEGLLFLNASLLQYCRFLEERVYVMQTLNAAERYRWALKRYPRLDECATTTQIASFLGVTKETLYRIRGGKYVADGHSTHHAPHDDKLAKQ